VIHLNEGHSAFAPLEYARHLMTEHGLSFEQARMQSRSRTVFTTHTPVVAGHDRFSSDLMGKITWKYRESLGVTHEQLMDLGRVRPGDDHETFCMTVLALKTASRSNGVSFIHGQVSRQMWNQLWPDSPPQHVPIGHITNGINVLGWLAPPMRRLFDQYFTPDWKQRIGKEEVWQQIHAIPDEELWNTAMLLKARLLAFLPRLPHRAHPEGIKLDPRVLTIGFARRFAGYKRATLLLDDPDRFAKLLSDPARPVQIIFSGKAHPRDSIGQEMVKKVYRSLTDPRFSGKLVFIEDYDVNVARHLVQGVDLWLNTPRQAFEASGTSGMKVALNGGLNLSILDGWWPEGYDGNNGFGVRGSRNENDQVRDGHDREALYETLEQEVIPLYYKQDTEGVPGGWVHRMKEAMCTLGWRFSSDRMVIDYATHCYLPAGGISTCQMDAPFV
jgi:starch phosphorylase